MEQALEWLMAFVFPIVMGMALISIVGLFLLQVTRAARYSRQNQRAKEAIERMRNKHIPYEETPHDTR